MSYVITKNGETQRVASLDGYADWEVVASSVPEPPSDFCTLVNGKWVEDQTAKAAAARKRAVAELTREQLVARIEDLERRVAALEKK